MNRRDLLLGAAAAATTAASAQSTGEPLRIAISGLVHGHVGGFLNGAVKRQDCKIVGLADPSQDLRTRYAERYKIQQTYASTTELIDKTKPEVVASFGSTFDHAAVVEACAAKKVPVMMEKPLAVGNDHAKRIAKAAATSGIPVIVNYETTWYASHGEIWKLLHDQKAAGDIRRMVIMDGHQGPKEIGVQPEFLEWLTDPVKNGAGALFDFGCYGANLMTWMMDNARPTSILCLAKCIKPEIYPKVDDDATILVEYPKAQGVIEASWNWPFSRKDFEVYGQTGYAIATGGNNLRVRLNQKSAEETRTPEPLPQQDRDSISYLISVVRDKRKVTGLSSLENNLIVTEILSAARESAKLGRRVNLSA
ncbi:MAG: Gfo/Idh/MocA family oxidoreductase [Bryobacteraceae bacterium]|nr:Gfo/Idh/MocA family oxidoreductase [Bryobacteraceae bacterium]